MNRRGLTVPWLITYLILLLLVVSLLPGLITLNNAGIANYDNKSDPSYVVLSAFPIILFVIYLFRPWQLMGREGGY